jgi:hypothetical protein
MLTRLAAITLLTIAGCRAESDVISGTAIRDSIRVSQLRHPDSILPVGQFVPGPWRELYIFEPYTPKSAVARCLGAAHAPSTEGIESRDDIHLLIIRRQDGELVSRAVPRGSPEFDPSGASAVYSSTATFRVGRDSAQASWTITPFTGLLRRCAPEHA